MVFRQTGLASPSSVPISLSTAAQAASFQPGAPAVPCLAWWWPCPGNSADPISLAGRSARAPGLLGKASLGSAGRWCQEWHQTRALELNSLDVSPTSP